MSPVGNEPIGRREATELRRLARDAKARREAGCLVVEGRRLVREALRLDTRVRQVVFLPEAIEKDSELREAIEAAEARGVDCRPAAAARFEQISSLKTPQGALAIVERLASDIDALASRASFLGVAALGIQDPTNTGALARSAAAFGADALLLSPDSGDVFGPKGIRASSGTVLTLPVATLEIGALLELARSHAIAIYAADAHSTDTLDSLPEAAPRALLAFGGEGGGLPPEISAAAAARYRIPTSDRVESLNVTAAAAIALHRFARVER